MEGGKNECRGTDADNSQAKSATNTPSTQPRNPKRRRGHGIVTPNACTHCRKKRAKVIYIKLFPPQEDKLYRDS